MSTVKINDTKNKVKLKSAEMQEALKEAEIMMKNPDSYPSYNNVEELLEALDEEKNI